MSTRLRRDVHDVDRHADRERRPRVPARLERRDRGRSRDELRAGSRRASTRGSRALSCIVAGDACGNRAARPSRTTGVATVTSRPERQRRRASEARAARRASDAIPGADVAAHARDRPHRERREDAPHRPLERPGDLHRRERRLAVVPEHGAVHDEDQRLQERLRDGRQREAADLAGRVRDRALRRAAAQTDRSLKRLRSEQARRRRPRSRGSSRSARSIRLDGALGLASGARRRGPCPRSRTSEDDVAARCATAGRRSAKIASRMRRRCCGNTVAASTFCPG